MGKSKQASNKQASNKKSPKFAANHGIEEKIAAVAAGSRSSSITSIR